MSASRIAAIWLLAVQVGCSRHYRPNLEQRLEVLYIDITTSLLYPVVRRERSGARGIHIPVFYSLFNGQPVGATNQVSQPSNRSLGLVILDMTLNELLDTYPCLGHLQRRRRISWHLYTPIMSPGAEDAENHGLMRKKSIFL